MGIRLYGDMDISDAVSEENLEYNPNKDFTSLNCWQKARDVKLFFYNKIITMLTSDEKFNLGLQIRKAAVSTTANIAEGYGRYHYKESIQFYRISRGSLYELKDHLITCNDLNFINSDILEEGTKIIEEAKRLLNGYISFTFKKIK